MSIGVALANQPPLLLADEPTGELDTHTSEEIFDLFASLNSELGVTVIIVTHDPAIAARVDRVVAIRDGRIATETFRHLEYGAAARAPPPTANTPSSTAVAAYRFHRRTSKRSTFTSAPASS